MPNQEFPQAWEHLDLSERRYISALHEEGFLDLNQASMFIDIFLNPGSITGQTVVELTQLKKYAVAPLDATHPKIRRGWKLLADFVEVYKPSLRKNGISVFVSGSMHFHDPQKLDLDLTLFTSNENMPVYLLWDDAWEEELAGTWRTSGGELDAMILSAQRLKNHCDTLTTAAEGLTNAEVLRMSADFERASWILAGYPLFVPKSHSLESTHRQIFDLCLSQPVMGAEVLLHLRSSLALRKQRRD